MKYLIILLLIVGIQSMVLAQKTLNPKFEQKIESIIDNSVTTISCDRLNKKITTPNLYILDAREKEEYDISHIKGAAWVGYNTFSKKKINNIPKDAIVVIYCSIGYRSEKIGEKLKKEGYQKVYNLYGGIFEWSNKKYPLVDNQQTGTTKVHAYNKDWGRWVEKGDKVY